jgi:hypothetical protein
MLIELDVIVDLYDTPNSETGEAKLIKKGIIYKKTFNTEATTVEQYISDKGLVLKSYSNVTYNGQTFKVKESYEKVYNKLKPIKVGGLIKYAKGNYKN